MPARIACALVALCLTATGCGGAAAHEVHLAGEAFGSTWSVELVLREAPAPERLGALEWRVAGVLERVDRGMSSWRDDSELVRFNRRAGPQAFAFSPETRRVVVAALELARETGGAFDPTVAPLVALWGFGARAAARAPTAGELARARARVGWQQVAWDAAGRLRRQRPGVELDLAAIAKGYAVDAVVAELARERPRGLLVELGGEVRALGAKADGRPWRVGVENPGAPGARLTAVVALSGGALATSGDYRQARVVGGERTSHVVDPRSGRPVANGVASASVIAPTCMEADAVATALMVLGPEAGLAFVEERPWLEALLLIRDGERIVGRRASSGWSRWLAPEK